ncbi:IS66 family insertion sequence element accessory protein TnpA [Bacillus pseudomycoides]|uniref:IS66 family insertion sequence element accessory protein TnpA n=1 Tax=Bacillus pseudomycoides TaxID=64104 RepID=UPI0039FB8CA1
MKGAYIQDYKNSGLSKATWCQKQHLPVHRLYYWLKKFSPRKQHLHFLYLIF